MVSTSTQQPSSSRNLEDEIKISFSPIQSDEEDTDVRAPYQSELVRVLFYRYPKVKVATEVQVEDMSHLISIRGQDAIEDSERSFEESDSILTSSDKRLADMTEKRIVSQERKTAMKTKTENLETFELLLQLYLCISFDAKTHLI